MLKSFKYLVTAVVTSAALLSSVSVYADDNKEYFVKAAMMNNFFKFVSWPGEKSIDKQSKIDICVIGQSPMVITQPLFDKVSQQTGKRYGIIEEKNIKNVASHCHMVFISNADKASLPEVLNGLKGAAVLTVSDIPDFIDAGGMIGFVAVDSNIKFAVNSKAADLAGLRIDAQVLELAVKVVN